MNYNESMIRCWCEMTPLVDIVDKLDLWDDWKEQKLEEVKTRYHKKLWRRIRLCEVWLKEHDTALLNYTLAYLYHQIWGWEEAGPPHLIWKTTRYYAFKALRRNRAMMLPWLVLGDCYFMCSIGGGPDPQKPEMAKPRQFKDKWFRSFLDALPGSSMPAYEVSPQDWYQIKMAENSVRCIQRALKLAPQSREIKELFKTALWHRNQIMRPPWETRQYNL